MKPFLFTFEENFKSMKRLITFYEKLYFGFFMYSKNSRDDVDSKYHGEILLSICLMVIIIPILIGFTIIIKPITDSLNQKFFHFDDFSAIICSSLAIFFMLSHVLFFYYKKRNMRIIKKYMDIGTDKINEMKRRSGFFALFSFIWLSIGITILFIYSQFK